MKTVVVTGGGTGGHVFTGLAVLDEVRRREPDAHTVFVGSSAGHEVVLVPRSGHRFAAIDVRPLRVGGFSGAVRGLARIPGAVRSAARLLTQLGPEVVLGIGGAASGPTLVAARWLGIPALLHEQNTVAGLASRLAAGAVSRVLVGLPQARGRFAGRPDVVITGNPVRRELAAALERRAAEREMAGASAVAEGPVRVLVFGGSDGSSFLNRRLPAALARAAAQAGRDVLVHHQAGAADCEALRRVYASGRITAVVAPFFEDMGARYAETDLAIALAGAGTLAEIALGGVPSVVVPLAGSADDHQRENARHYARGGGIRLLDEAAWSETGASCELGRLIADAAAREALGAKVRRLAMPDAAARIVDELTRAAR